MSAAQRNIWDRARRRSAGSNVTADYGSTALSTSRRFTPRLEGSSSVTKSFGPVSSKQWCASCDRPFQGTAGGAIEDLRGQSDLETLLVPLLERLAAQPFDPSVPPLLRVRLIRVSETEHWLLRSWHHLVCDAASSAIFAGELGSLYESLVHGGSPPPPDPPQLQYSDYACWEQTNMGSGSPRWTAEVDWWQRHLEGVPPTPSFPFRREPAQLAESGGTEMVEAELEPDVSAALDRLGRELGATLFMTRVAAFSALCALDGETDDLVLGMNVTMRRFARLRETIGPLSNSTMLRLNLSEAATFRDSIPRCAPR